MYVTDPIHPIVELFGENAEKGFKQLVLTKQLAHVGNEDDAIAMGIRIVDEYNGVKVANSSRKIIVEDDSITTQLVITYSISWEVIGSETPIDIVKDTLGSVGYTSSTHGTYEEEEEIIQRVIKEMGLRLKEYKIKGRSAECSHEDTNTSTLLANLQIEKPLVYSWYKSIWSGDTV